MKQIRYLTFALVLMVSASAWGQSGFMPDTACRSAQCFPPSSWANVTWGQGVQGDSILAPIYQWCPVGRSCAIAPPSPPPFTLDDAAKICDSKTQITMTDGATSWVESVGLDASWKPLCAQVWDRIAKRRAAQDATDMDRVRALLASPNPN